jgi:peptidoglycan/LPS O-acetylase OafA/YrhL
MSAPAALAPGYLSVPLTPRTPGTKGTSVARVSSLSSVVYETLPAGEYSEDEVEQVKPPKPPAQIAHLNGLRALALIGVILFHFRHGCQGGFLGVDVFFVLSGYLMTRSIASQIACGSFSYLTFLWRRFWRLYPALLCTTAATLALTYAFFATDLVLQVAQSAEAATFAVSNLLFMSEEGYFGTSSMLKPLLHTWSLSVEWQFYLLWPLMMSYASRFSRVLRPFWPLAIFCAGSFGYGLIIASSMPQAAFFMLPGRAFEFGLGALVLTSAPLVTSHKMGNAMSISGTAMIVLSFTHLNSAHGAPALIALPSLIGALLIISSPSTVAANRIYTNVAFEYLGKISYSAYLIHWPVFVFLHNIYEHAPAPWEVEATVVSFMMVLSALMYHFVEDEMRTGNKRWHRALGLVLIVFVLLSARHAAATNGWDMRFAREAKNLRTRAHSHTVYLREVKNLYKPSLKILPGTDRKIEYGILPNSTTKSVEGQDSFDALVVGDSFAAPFAGAFDAIAKEQNKTFVLTSHYSCAPFFDKVSMDPTVKDYANPSNNPRAKLCKESLRKDMFDLIKATKANVVVLTGNWLATSQMWRAGYESVNMYPTSKRKKKLRQSQLEESIWRLHKLNRKLVVVGMIPGAHFNVRACMTATGPLAGFKKCPETSRFKEPLQGTDYLQRQMRNRVSIRNVFNALMSNSNMLVKAQKEKWLVYVDPYDVLCNDVKGDCIVARGGEPYYSDEYHLTGNGTVLLKETISSAISSLK